MTYSIVARDPSSGRLGVAVQSHFLGVGPVVPWARAGVGAVATQAQVNISFGPLGLELLAAGRSANEAVAALIASDADARERQVGVVDAGGRATAFTGEACIPDAGHLAGDGFSVQGNLLRSPSVWPEMARAYEAAVAAPFSERLLRALEAGEAAGGDVRGRQSAAMLIVGGDLSAAAWEARHLDLHVEDHPDPLAELRRLVGLAEAYALVGETEFAPPDERPMAERYSEARRRAPAAYELVFWRGVDLARAGDEAAARRELAIAFAAEPTWREALRHVAAAGHLGEKPGLLERLLA